jgi:tRNA(Ser,Leu) C12 N-acetylase TAN1
MQHEARRILRHLGDKHPHIEWSSVEGIAVAHTTLDNRAVIRQCRQLLHDGEEKFEHAVKWLPVDYWCETELDAIKQVIEQQVVARIDPRERWGMVVKKRRWQRYHTAEIIAYLAPAIDRPVDLAHPDKLVWIDVLGRQTAIAVLKPGEIFSVILEGG